MQHVKQKWLDIFNYTLVGLDVFIIGLYFWLRATSPQTLVGINGWGLNTQVAILAGIHLVYMSLIYPFIRKRIPWLSSVLSDVVWIMMFGSMIDASGNTNLIFRLGYAVFIFAMAVDGVFPPVATASLTWVVLVFTTNNIISGTRASIPFNILMDVIISLAALFGWLFFKRFYLQPDPTKAYFDLARLLKQEQTKSSFIFESITDGVMILDTQGTIQSLNQSAATMLGWEKPDALHLQYDSIIKLVDENPSDDTKQIATKNSVIETTLRTAKAAKKISLVETHHQRRLYVDFIASPILSDQPDSKEKKLAGVVVVMRDVDEQQRQERQRSDFISTASHEMRTPVASIQGFIELALNPKVDTIDDKARGYLEKAQSATKHLGDLFQDLLTVSKSEDGHLTNNPKIIEIGEFLKEAVEQDKLLAEKKGLKIILESAKASDKTIAPLLYVNADPERLREVIFNLLDNAVKYTTAGMITVGYTLKNQGVVIRVSDTGIGIAEEDIPHLFQKFYRTDSSATREIGGTGLGLYICKQIVEMMGGTIWVESTVDAGSTFYVEIPRVSPDVIQKLNPNQT